MLALLLDLSTSKTCATGFTGCNTAVALNEVLMRGYMFHHGGGATA